MSAETPVRVRYRRDGNGWAFAVLSADGALKYLGGGWSAGKKADARQDFEAQCRRKGWTL